MIVGYFGVMEIGERRRGLTDGYNVDHPDQPFVVVREATFDEWVSNHNANCGEPLTQEQLNAARSAKAHFYEVATD